MTKNRQTTAITNWQKKNPDKVKEYRQRYREKNREKLSKQQREYRKNNPDKIKSWKKKNKEKINEYRKRYNEKNVEKLREYRKKRRISPNEKYLKYQSNAKKRGRVFTLTFEEFEKLIFSEMAVCYYCGSKEKLGIDRDVNKKGYTKENSKTCCWSCNSLKGTLVDGNEFIKLCLSVAKNSTIRGGDGH